MVSLNQCSALLGDGNLDIRRHNSTLRTAETGLRIVRHVFRLGHLVEIGHIVAALRELRRDQRLLPSHLSKIAPTSARGVGWSRPERYLIHVEFQT